MSAAARPFWRTLPWRLTLAFVLVSALALGIVGLASYASTRAEFNTLLGAQAREQLASEVQTYVSAHGTVQGFRPAPPLQDAAPGGVGGPFRGGPGGDGRRHGPFVVLDTARRALYSTPEVTGGQAVQGGPLTPVRVNGQLVAYLAPSGARPRPDARSAEFLARTTRAIAWAMLGAVGLAVLTGMLLARSFLQPLQQLLVGIHALQRGETPTALASRRADEFGEVLSAFDDMHASVTRNQRARQQLTANIAHDLNTPLAVVSGTLEGMLDGTFRVTPERLGRLHRETAHIAQLVNDLRFLSLADAGELKMQRRPTDLLPLLEDAVGTFRERAEAAGVTLGVDGPADLPTVAVDGVRLTQVMQNLLSNALTYTPSGGRVQVRVERAGEAVRVTVQDSGVGLAPGAVPHVFDRLYRADGARSSGGSGLGLSICRSIVEAHGGHIALSSVEGQGTTVVFELPLAVG
ncbi:sensor histidine kinase [Deinococcus maricopensis]|uniref:histidine kinase n=1 Tax=Deinococcus maricopensis (strain DSM 21211 / LMG 22137 / NRRL B-23946 / LB-34) TaxID=709986 RepID=E8U459_DEIML|nr:ATP-binding protein [Deinococcus maricopensis]ADV65896.1 integral membrane sensor signal transduction histidine kinase [Deinococcus maricopensis DSM 21211]